MIVHQCFRRAEHLNGLETFRNLHRKSLECVWGKPGQLHKQLSYTRVIALETILSSKEVCTFVFLEGQQDTASHLCTWSGHGRRAEGSRCVAEGNRCVEVGTLHCPSWEFVLTCHFLVLSTEFQLFWGCSCKKVETYPSFMFFSSF